MSPGELEGKSPAPAGAGIASRAGRTLELAESRGYVLTLQSLSRLLVGGPVDPGLLADAVRGHGELEFDGRFVCHRGSGRAAECARRLEANGRWGPLARGIARDFCGEYVRLCPHVRCVMLAGSAASGGFCEEDDIDLNIVVRDGTKYTSYITALLLSLKYSILHGRRLGSSFIPGVPKVICVNVVWEERQVTPFSRRDMQLAFELLNSSVLHGPQFHRRMLDANPWVAEFFPQIAGQEANNRPRAAGREDGGARMPSETMERLSRDVLFAAYNIAWGLRGRQPHQRERMRFVERAKSPYGIFDVPGGAAGRSAGCSK